MAAKEIFKVTNSTAGRIKEDDDAIRFRGCYQHCPEWRGDSPWLSEEWMQFNQEKLEALEGHRTAGLFGHAAQLVLLLNQLSLVGKEIRVTDYGGGTGWLYYLIYPSLFLPELVHWHVVDPALSMHDLGTAHSHGGHRIEFHPDLPTVACDIVLLNTSLQYMYDYRQQLGKLLYKTRASYFVTTRTMAGDCPSYFTLQSIFSRITPCLVVNREALSSFLTSLGYRLFFWAPAVEESFAGMFADDIPEKYQLDTSVNLFFAKV